MNWSIRYASERPGISFSQAIQITKDRAANAVPFTGNQNEPIVGFTGETGSIYRRLPRTVPTGELWTPGGEWPQWDRVKSQEQQVMHEAQLGEASSRYKKPQDISLWVHPDVNRDAANLVLSPIGLHILTNDAYHENDYDPNDKNSLFEKTINGPLLIHGEHWNHMPINGWSTHEFKNIGGKVAFHTHPGHAPVTIHHGTLPQGADDLFRKYEGTDLIW